MTQHAFIDAVEGGGGGCGVVFKLYSMQCYDYVLT